jgi:hypothetical protein
MIRSNAPKPTFKARAGTFDPFPSPPQARIDSGSPINPQ